MREKDRFSIHSKPVRLVLLAVVIAALAVLAYRPGAAQAAPTAQNESPPEQVPMQNDECLDCHKTPDMYRELPSGEKLYLTVDRVAFETSIHGRQGYSCVQCHSNITGYPHPV